MEKPKWKDGVLRTPKMRITITNKHIHHPGEWVISVRELDWLNKNMGIGASFSESDAQDLAELMVMNELSAMLSELKELTK